MSNKQIRESKRLNKALNNKSCVSCHNLRVHPEMEFENKVMVKCRKNKWEYIEKSEGINRKVKEYIRLSYMLSTINRFEQISYRCDNYEVFI